MSENNPLDGLPLQQRAMRNEQFMIPATSAAGQSAVKSAILINGGAAVAVLAFAGSLVQKGGCTSGFRWILLCFAGGTLFAAIASTTDFLSGIVGCQFLANVAVGGNIEKARPCQVASNTCHRLTLLLIALSYAMFIVGVCLASCHL